MIAPAHPASQHQEACCHAVLPLPYQILRRPRLSATPSTFTCCAALSCPCHAAAIPRSPSTSSRPRPSMPTQPNHVAEMDRDSSPPSSHPSSSRPSATRTSSRPSCGPGTFRCALSSPVLRVRPHQGANTNRFTRHPSLPWYSIRTAPQGRSVKAQSSPPRHPPKLARPPRRLTIPFPYLAPCVLVRRMTTSSSPPSSLASGTRAGR